MIGSLQGVISEKEPPRLLIEVGGVGYDVEVPMSTFLSLPATGSAVRLRIHHVLREDASLLFGFATEEERALFRALLKISGVGPRMALGILSGVTPEVFQRAVADDDASTLTRIPGVGRKTAERLLVEMRDYFGSLQANAGKSAASRSPADEAMNALLSLGFKPAEASRMLEPVKKDGLSTEELIHAALRNLPNR
jgi:holliday junction DNA helicase RuvA